MLSKKRLIDKPKSRLPLEAEFTAEFRKDWKKLQHSGRCDMERLKALMVKLIANDGPLDAIHREHELTGDWAGFQECHMGGDVLLIYDRSDTRIVFTRAGSHAALFEN